MDKNKTAERIRRIQEVVQVLKQLEKQNLDLDHDNLVLEVCLQFNCSERKAKEYIKIAKHLNAK